MATRDRISELPAEILDHILGFLPIEEAVKTAVLSTMWRDIWFSLTQLNFDGHFFRYIDRKYHYANIYVRKSAGLNVTNKILLQHNGGIRKFVLNNFNSGIHSLMYQPADFDRWLHLVTQKGVEEIDIALLHSAYYRVPNCIFSCSTLKRLHLSHVHVEPVNFPCKLPKVTSLCFVYVHFGPRNLLDCAVDTPILENLLFSHCQNMSHFNITAPKLCSLRIELCLPRILGNFLPVNLDLRSVCTLDLDGGSLPYFVEELNRMGLPLQQVALNVEYLKISNFFLRNYVMTYAFIQLLRACPRFCKLDISFWFGGVSEASCVDGVLNLLEKLRSLSRTHKMFRVLKLSSFKGYGSEILLIKRILDCFPTLEKVVITPCKMLFCRNAEFEIMQKILHFPGHPTKTEIVFVY